MDIKDIIKKKRTEKGLTMKELAEKVGVSEATISRWESGEISNMKHKGIILLADVLGISPNVIMGWEEQPELEIIGQVERSREYPYIPNPVAAGVPETIEGINNLPTISIPDHFLGRYAGNKDIIIMKVNGESMNNIIPNGSIIGVIRNYPISSLNDGDLVVFNCEYEYSVKHFYKTDSKLIFKPNSTEVCFTDLVYNLDDNINIVGKVVMYSVVLDWLYIIYKHFKDIW